LGLPFFDDVGFTGEGAEQLVLFVFADLNSRARRPDLDEAVKRRCSRSIPMCAVFMSCLRHGRRRLAI
jgi:hypothetical protein